MVEGLHRRPRVASWRKRHLNWSLKARQKFTRHRGGKCLPGKVDSCILQVKDDDSWTGCRSRSRRGAGLPREKTVLAPVPH